MNKGTAIVGFLMSFLAGMFLMWGLDKGKGPDIQAESGSASGIPDQSSASVPVSANGWRYLRVLGRSPKPFPKKIVGV